MKSEITLHKHSFFREFLLRFGLYFTLFMFFMYAKTAVTSEILLYPLSNPFVTGLHSVMTMSLFVSLFITVYKRRKRGDTVLIQKRFFTVIIAFILSLFVNISWIVPENNYRLIQNVSHQKGFKTISRGNREVSITALMERRRDLVQRLEKRKKIQVQIAEKERGKESPRSLRRVRVAENLVLRDRKKIQNFDMEILKHLYIPLHIVPILLLSYGLSLTLGAIRKNGLRRGLTLLLVPPVFIKSHMLFYLSFQTNRFHNTVPAVTLLVMSLLGAALIVLGRKLPQASTEIKTY